MRVYLIAISVALSLSAHADAMNADQKKACYDAFKRAGFVSGNYDPQKGYFYADGIARKCAPGKYYVDLRQGAVTKYLDNRGGFWKFLSDWTHFSDFTDREVIAANLIEMYLNDALKACKKSPIDANAIDRELAKVKNKNESCSSSIAQYSDGATKNEQAIAVQEAPAEEQPSPSTSAPAQPVGDKHTGNKSI